jgi:hypothetical protein
LFQVCMVAMESLQARLAEVATHSQQRLSAAATLWTSIEQALEVPQRAALRLACWPLLPDPVQLAQRWGAAS